MQFLEQLQKKQQTRREAVYQKYRGLMGKATLAGELNKADQRELEEAVESLGMTPEAVAEDAGALVRERELVDKSRDIPALAAAATEAEAELGRIRTQYAAIQVEYEQKFNDAQTGIQRTSQENIRAQAAAQELAILRRDKWRLLGAEDPAIVSNRRKIARGIFVERFSGEIGEAILVENVMQWDVVPENLFNRQFVPMDGQSPEEVEELVNIVRDIADAKAKGVTDFAYLLPDEWRARVRRVGMAALFESDAINRDLHMIYDDRDKGDNFDGYLARFHFVPAPDQTADDFSALIKKVRNARLRKAKRIGGGSPMPTIYEPVTGTVPSLK